MNVVKTCPDGALLGPTEETPEVPSNHPVIFLNRRNKSRGLPLGLKSPQTPPSPSHKTNTLSATPTHTLNCCRSDWLSRSGSLPSLYTVATPTTGSMNRLTLVVLCLGLMLIAAEAVQIQQTAGEQMPGRCCTQCLRPSAALVHSYTAQLSCLIWQPPAASCQKAAQNAALTRGPLPNTTHFTTCARRHNTPAARLSPQAAAAVA